MPKRWAIHITLAPKDRLHERVLHERMVDCRLDNFQRVIDLSCHFFVRMARLAKPLMSAGGSLITMCFYGAERAMRQYTVMRPVKAALESFVRYLTEELTPRGIRV